MSALSVYDQEHPLIVSLARRRALAARVNAWTLEQHEPAPSPAPRDIRVAIARSAADLVRTAEARWLAAARAERLAHEAPCCTACGLNLDTFGHGHGCGNDPHHEHCGTCAWRAKVAR